MVCAPPATAYNTCMTRLFQPLKPKIVLGIAAHPDDLDAGAAGSMAKFAADGAEVYYLILTDGAKGTQDRQMTPERLRDVRHAEQRSAGDVLGLKDVFFLDYPDGALQNTLDLKRDVVRMIRKIRPDTVVTWDPACLYSVERGLVNHPDHRVSGQATLDAVYPLARDHLAFPELLHDEGLEPHKVQTVLMLNFDTYNFAVDVTATLELKFKALAAHASQTSDLAARQTLLTQQAGQIGSRYGYKYAEGFVRLDVESDPLS